MDQTTSRPSDPHLQASSPLLRLTGELRNQIYTYILYTGTYHITISRTQIIRDISATNTRYRKKITFNRLRDTPPTHFSFLRVCRQIYTETRLLPFTLNTFCFYSIRMCDFLETLPPPQCMAITSVQVTMSPASRRREGEEGIEADHVDFVKSMAMLPALRKFRVVDLPVARKSMWVGLWSVGKAETAQEMREKIIGWLSESGKDSVEILFEEVCRSYVGVEGGVIGDVLVA
jgi:hypothetical protein